jgi:DNA-binding NarL/FixJ family response regulator
VVAPSTTRRLLEHFAATLPDPTPAAPDTRLAELTERELEVLVLIGGGLSNQEIAAELYVAEATVKTHVSRLLAKTGSRDRVQLVVLAYGAKLVG